MSLWRALKTWLIDFPGHPGSSKNDPSYMAPLVKSWQPKLTLVRSLYEGFESLYRHRFSFLPQHPAEDPTDYDIRSRRPTFYNAFGRTVRALAGIVFREPPTAEGIPQDILDLFEDDIDNEGTDGPSFLRGTFQDGLVTGLAGIFVDQPTVDGAMSRADELDAGVRPYWHLVRMDDIVSFRTVVENGVTMLAQLVFCEERQLPDGDYGVKVIERLRAYRRIPTQAAGESGDSVPAQVTEILYEKDQRGGYVPVGNRVMPEVEEIPLAMIYTNRVDFMDAAPPLMDLAFVNLLHYQMSSDLHHAAHIANVPFLFGIGIKEDEMRLGPNQAVLVESGDETTTLRWVETTGASLGSTRAILADLEEQMANLGLGMLQRKSRAAETAEKATIDKQEQDSTLAGIVGDLEDGIERALFYTSVYLKLATWGRFTFGRDFQVEPAGAQRTDNQGEPQPPKEPAKPGQTNNPRTTA